MTRRQRPSGEGEHHNAMVTYESSDPMDNQGYRAWCEDCDWSIGDQNYSQAIDHALTHQQASEVVL